MPPEEDRTEETQETASEPEPQQPEPEPIQAEPKTSQPELEQIPAPVEPTPEAPAEEIVSEEKPTEPLADTNEPEEPTQEESTPTPPPLAPEPKPQPVQATPSVTSPQINIRELAAKARALIQSRKRKKLDRILAFLSTKPSITNDEVEKLLHVSDATATRYLTQLEKEGKIRQVGKTGRSVKYSKL